MKTSALGLGIALVLMGVVGAASAQTRPRELALSSLEELMQIEITSAARKEQRADAVAAAVFVLTRDDIRRSGLRTLPELLRLVPGVQVAQVNSSRVAVSVRGFNNLYSNKLLVLIDGRSIYSRVFSGVFWDAQDLLVDDIARIEVIRGPGGALWGANAVNGVINIVTMAAADTQGLLVRVGAGTVDPGQVAARYGATFGDIAFRVSSLWSGHGQSLLPDGSGAADNWSTVANGFRADWERNRNAVTVEGSVLTNRTRPLWLIKSSAAVGPATDLGLLSRTRDASVLARWTYNQYDGSSLQVQSFVTRREADLADVREREVVNDVDVQYHTRVGRRHDVVLGGGFRQGHVEVDGSFMYSLNPSRSPGRVTSLFVQDEISLSKVVRVTVGSKLEHELVTGWSVQPTVRGIWEVVPGRQSLWVAVSRAIRTPSAADLHIRVNFDALPGPGGMPVLLGLVGNPDRRSEDFVDQEAGYRLRIGSMAFFKVTAFRGRYQHLMTTETLDPVFEASPAPAHLFVATRFGNELDVDTTGVEVTAHLAPTSWWRVDGSYSGLKLVPHLRASSRDRTASAFDGSAPSRQWQVHSSVRAGDRMELGGGVFHSGVLRQFAIPAYTRADARAAFRITPQLWVEATGQNLLHRAHAEFGADISLTTTLAARAFNASLIWRPQW